MNTTSAIEQLNRDYGVSCTKYESKTDRTLHNSHVIIVAGYGCQIKVRDDALVVLPGTTHAGHIIKAITLHKGMHTIRNIVLLADSGAITFDSIHWCHDQNICITMIDVDGSLIQSMTPEHSSQSALRRRQYNADPLPISQWLLHDKTESQIDVLKLHPELPGSDAATRTLEKSLSFVPDSIDLIRTVEGRLAKDYFSVFDGHPLKWSRSKVPSHWCSIAERTSLLAPNDNGRHATNPYQAMLNYGLSLLESQVRQEINVVGLDASCGFLHADKVGRDSLVFDLMEPHRAFVDHLTFQLVKKTTFQRADFIRCDDGRVRLNPQLARYICASCRVDQRDVAQTVHRLVSIIA